MVVILVVSREARTGRNIRSVLGSQGWWVTTAADREEALRAAADHEPALVIVDCEVEGAAELVRTFGVKHGGPGVLLLEPPDRGDGFFAFEAGADQVLSKPPRARALLEAAERVMSLPYQSGASQASNLGEQLSASEIFGELLEELDATDPKRASSRARAAPAEVAEADAPEPESPAEVPEPPSARETPSDVPAPRQQPQAAREPREATAVETHEEASGMPLEAAAEDAEPEPPALAAGPEPPTANAKPAPPAVAPEPEPPAVTVEPEAPALAAAPEPPAVASEPAYSRSASVGDAPGSRGPAEPLPGSEGQSADSDEMAQEGGAIEEPNAVEDLDEQSFRFDPEELGAAVDRIGAPTIAEPGPPAEPTPQPARDVASELAPEESAPGGQSPPPSSQPSFAAAPVPADADQDRFGQYRLDERIAVGGMAEVWRASMLGMEGFRKTVAIKKILPHLAENDEFVAMFIEEAKLAAQLSHENLVEIYDLGKIGDSFFIAMEYVDGRDLRGVLNRLRQGGEQMPIGLALLVASEVARGLEYAHAREDSDGRPLALVHRDVSPRNILIGRDGRVRLCDFGVAKAVSSVIQTQIGALKGKLQYMSPEQASGRPVDNRSDIYSLGSVLYEMIVGRRLYEEDNEISLLDAARAGNFDDPRKHAPGLPEEVRRILIKALAKKPSARYQSAGDLERDLRKLQGGLEPLPGLQALGDFVGELFAERPSAGEATEARDGSMPPAFGSAQAPIDGPSALTRSLQVSRPAMASRVTRFWLGVAAGLLVAGLGAALLKLLS